MNLYTSLIESGHLASFLSGLLVGLCLIGGISNLRKWWRNRRPRRKPRFDVNSFIEGPWPPGPEFKGRPPSSLAREMAEHARAYNDASPLAPVTESRTTRE